VIASRICPALSILIAILVASIPSRAQMPARIAPADILIVHAKVYTLDQHAPWAQALAIRRGKIVAVGSDEVVGRMRGIGTRVIDANAVKFMLDGVVESHTAAFRDPYSVDPSLKGSLFWDAEKYKAAVAELDKRGLRLFTHAIGDSGIRTALDAYDFAKTKNHTKDHRPRVEHIEDVSAPDLLRFGTLGVIASMQPLHSYPDADTLDVWARNVGPERATRAWLWKTIADDGGHYAFGSDGPVVTLNPFEGIQVAVTRQTTDGKPPCGFISSQRLTVAKAIEGYTLDAAYAGRRETGKLADLIIVDRNLLEIDPQNIHETKVVFTIVGGEVVYEAETK